MTAPMLTDRYPELSGLAYDSRELLELAWSAETAFQGIQLLPEDVPSRGQCGVSSLWFSRRLVERGFEAKFTEGLIQLDGLNDEHVWVEVALPDYQLQVIDLTSDQYQTNNRTKVHIGAYDSGWGTIGKYVPHQRFEPFEVPRKKLLKRHDILESNIDRLPRRKKKFLK